MLKIVELSSLEFDSGGDRRKNWQGDTDAYQDFSELTCDIEVRKFRWSLPKLNYLGS